jgi:hypothetical protein
MTSHDCNVWFSPTKKRRMSFIEATCEASAELGSLANGGGLTVGDLIEKQRRTTQITSNTGIFKNVRFSKESISHFISTHKPSSPELSDLSLLNLHSTGEGTSHYNLSESYVTVVSCGQVNLRWVVYAFTNSDDDEEDEEDEEFDESDGSETGSDAQSLQSLRSSMKSFTYTGNSRLIERTPLRASTTKKHPALN